MPDYVAVLAGDVVNGNPANAYYQGQPLGNLAEQGVASGTLTTSVPTHNCGPRRGGSGGQMVLWNRPSGHRRRRHARGATYWVAAGSLFGNAPTPSSGDMAQGNLGDCYFISALGAIADSSPSAIANMIIDNGVENGMHTWTVRFYYEGPAGYVADYVTVNALLAAYPAGNLAYADSVSGGWWIPFVEKAYAQWNETGHEGRDGQNAYASLAGGCMPAVDAQVLGSTATTYCPAADPTAEQALIAAIQNGAAVTAAIFTNGDPQFDQLDLVTGHAYMIAGYDSDPASATFGTFRLKNPWGFYDPAAPLTWDELCSFCPWLAVAAPPGSKLTGRGHGLRRDSRRHPTDGGGWPAGCGGCGGLSGGQHRRRWRFCQSGETRSGWRPARRPVLCRDGPAGGLRWCWLQRAVRMALRDRLTRSQRRRVIRVRTGKSITVLS